MTFLRRLFGMGKRKGVECYTCKHWDRSEFHELCKRPTGNIWWGTVIQERTNGSCGVRGKHWEERTYE